MTRLRDCDGDKVDELISYLSNRTADLDRWPDDAEWRYSWIMREQYKSARQPRLRYIFEAMERAKRTSLSEDIEIRSALTIEHIMPQKWQESWPIPEMVGLSEDQYAPEHISQIRAREAAVNVIGNLTLLTQALNSTISNGPLSDKLPAIKANTALALNREIHGFETWNEATIAERGAALFEVAAKLWTPPERAEIPGLSAGERTTWTVLPTPFPADGTKCRFTYMGKDYAGSVVDGALVIEGVDGRHASFSSASRAVTSTSRNGWNDWYIATAGGDWVLAADWRHIATVDA